MSRKMTKVRIRTEAALRAAPPLLDGHVTYETAVARLCEHYERLTRDASEVLAALYRGDIEVSHQIGIYRVSSSWPVRPEGEVT